MKKIWDKGLEPTNAFIEAFTIGKDRLFDAKLAQYDVIGSKAHVKMLAKVGLLTNAESYELIFELDSILKRILDGNFVIDENAEDIHSYVEAILIKKLGQVGKKIHTGRSRNDQVLTAIKLYLKDELLQIANMVEQLFEVFQELSEQYKNDLMPGYTHFQMAMPSSFGLWFGAYAEALVDDMEEVACAYAMCNKNPLGSAAGYGSSFPLDRHFTTQELGFATMNYNSIYAQMTRGKTEKHVANALAAIAYTLAKFSNDCCVFMNQHFGFIKLPENMTTGSSIMPHKQNPDVFELMRAKCNKIQSVPNEITMLLINLPLGYNRDMQLTKEILFPAIENTKECLTMMIYTLPKLGVTRNILNDQKFNLIFTVEAINALVKEGSSFRDAYIKVGKDVSNNTYVPDKKVDHTHSGSIGNLCTQEINELMQQVKLKLK